jgi:peptidoglycan biosynthesis protein MviN/MurJ (putative lipid II flippase)
VFKMMAASAVMGAVLLPFASLGLWKKGLSMKSGALLLICVVCGAAVYFGLLWIMGVRGLPQRARQG